MSIKATAAIGILALAVSAESALAADSPATYRAVGPFQSNQGPLTKVDSFPAISADGSRVAHAYDGSVYIYDRWWNEISRITCSPSPFRMRFGPDDETLLVADEDGTVWCVDLATGKTRWKTKVDDGRINDLDISSDGKLVAASGPLKVKLLDLSNGRVRGSVDTKPLYLFVSRGPLTTALFVSKGRYLAVVERDAVRFYPIQTGKGFRSTKRPKVVPLEKLAKSAVRSAKDDGLVLVTSGGVYSVKVTSTKAKRVKELPWVFDFVGRASRDRLVFVRTRNAVFTTSYRRPGKSAKRSRAYSQNLPAFSPGVGALLVTDTFGRKGKPRLAWAHLGARPWRPLATRSLSAEETPKFELAPYAFTDSGTLGTLTGRLDKSAFKPTDEPNSFVQVRDGPYLYTNRICSFEDDQDRQKKLPGSWGHKLEKPVAVTPRFVIGRSEDDSTLDIVTRATGKVRKCGIPERFSSSATTSRGGRFLFLAAGKPERYQIWDTQNDESVLVCKAPSRQHVAITEDGKRIVRVEKTRDVVCYSDARQRLWRTSLGTAPERVELSAEDDLVLAGDAVLDMATGSVRYELLAPGRLSAAGTHVLVGESEQRRAHILDVASGELVGVLDFVGPTAPDDFEIVKASKNLERVIARERGSSDPREHWIFERHED